MSREDSGYGGSNQAANAGFGRGSYGFGGTLDRFSGGQGGGGGSAGQVAAQGKFGHGYMPAPVAAAPMPQVPIPRTNPFSWLKGFTGPDPQFSVPSYPVGPSYGRGAPLGLPPGQNFNPLGQAPAPAGYPGATVYKNQNFPPATGPGGLRGNPGRPGGGGFGR